MQTEDLPLPLWVKILIGLLGSFAGLSTLAIAGLGFYFYKNKNKGEGVQAIEKGKQEQVHTTEAESDLQIRIQENELKRKTVPVAIIDELLQTVENDGKQIHELLKNGNELSSQLSKSVSLNRQQEDMIGRLNGIVSAQWERIELIILKFGEEQSGHKSCLELVGNLQKEVGRLTKRVAELENGAIHVSGSA